MKTKVFKPGAICTAAALLVVFSLPAYAKSGGSSSAQMRVGKTSSNATSVKPVTSSRKTQSGASQNIQLKSESKTLDQRANRLQFDTNKNEAAAQKADQQRKSGNDSSQAAKDSIKKTLDQANEIRRATGCGGLGC